MRIRANDTTWRACPARTDTVRGSPIVSLAKPEAARWRGRSIRLTLDRPAARSSKREGGNAQAGCTVREKKPGSRERPAFSLMQASSGWPAFGGHDNAGMEKKKKGPRGFCPSPYL